MIRLVFRVLPATLCLLAVTITATFAVSFAQDSADDARERQVADRFMEVLLRRPRPGTSLDRVYGYHIQAGTLDDLLAELSV